MYTQFIVPNILHYWAPHFYQPVAGRDHQGIVLMAIFLSSASAGRGVIHRANYAFRVVRVPEGDSTVEFRFRPPRLRAGIWISALTAVGLLLYAGLSARRGWYRSQAADAKESSD